MPLWRITLEAPQYPDGISMFIWINKITGDSEYTLQNINILNHYIGMQYIEPDSIPELKYFPIVVGLMVLFGLITAWLSPKFKLAWVIILVILSGLGVYDFYLWEYDYGHNLSPTAPIKVPGMVYQPPLFGSKMLLNFNAMSYPHWGALALLASICLGFYSFWRDRKVESPISLGTAPAVAALLIILFAGCSNSPQPISYGQDACHYCKMTIVDARFGAEGITEKGKVYKFDAIECMLNYTLSHKEATVFTNYVTPFDTPNTLLSAQASTFLIDSKIQSPMGEYLTAYSTSRIAGEHQQQYGGELKSWEGLRTYFDSIAQSN